MATMFKCPVVTVGVADSRQRRYDIASGSEGFYLYDELASLAKEGKLSSSFFPGNSLLQFGSQPTPHLIPIDRRNLQGVLLRPILRQPIPWTRATGHGPARRWGVVTSPGGAGWEEEPVGTEVNDFWDYLLFHPNVAPNWDFVMAEDGLLYEMTQKVSYTGTGENLSDWLISQAGFDGTKDDKERWQGLSPNPFFTAGFRRQAIPPEFLTALAAAPGAVEYASTQIVWGMNPEVFPDGKWMLHCPIVGRPTLYERILTAHPWSSENNPYWQPRQWTEGDLSEIKAEKAKDGYTYHIGTMGHAICVSEGGFGDNNSFAYYLVENASEPVVPYGSMVIRNWPGQCTFWLDFSVFPVGWLERWPFLVPSFRSADVASVILGEPFSAALQNATDWAPEIVATLPGVEGMGVNMLPLGLFEDMAIAELLRYKLQFTQGTYPVGADPTAEVVTQTTPFAEAVQLYQNPQLTDNGAPAFTETARGIIDLTTEAELEEMSAARQTLEIVNAEESFLPDDMLPEPAGGFSPTAEFRVGRQIQLTQVGWRVKDLTTDLESNEVQNLGHYYILEPRRDKRKARFDVTDLLGMVALNKWNGETDLNFRGWNIFDALAFGLELQGLGPEQYALEDTGMAVPDDEDQNYKRGTSWLKIFQGLLDRGGAIWYDPLTSKITTGCRFCRTARTSVDVLTHADAGWQSSGCLAADLVRVPGPLLAGVDFLAVLTPTGDGSPYPMYPVQGFEAEEVALDDREFANEITVVGSRPNAARERKDRHGNRLVSPEIVGIWRNPASLSWEYIVANPTEADDYIGFPISVYEKDDSLTTEQEVYRRVAELAAAMSPRPKKVRFDVPLLVTIRPGMVTKMQGGAFGECDGLKFRITGVRHNPGTGRTELAGRQMLGVCVG